MGKNAIVGQSGGPTSVINASLAGVFESCKSRGADIVYGMCNGVAGLLEERVVDLSTLLTDDLDIELLKRTPSSFLGSCRYKLPDWHTDETVYKKLFAILEKLNIGYFFYIGGNDSMDTIGKLAEYGECIQSDIRFMGVPKTIDNDLMVTDHTPGYGSAAKYIGVVMKEIIRDATVYGTKYVTVVEIMGRNAGWLTAAAALAKSDDCEGVDMICLPEVPFNVEHFIEKVRVMQEKKPSIVIAVSEGVKLEDGRYVCELADDVHAVDAFGHKALTGTARYLANVVARNLDTKTRCIELSTLQRCAGHLTSRTDTTIVNIGGIERRYKADISVLFGELGITYRWEDRTVAEQYSRLDINDGDFTTACSEIDASKLDKSIGVYTASGYDDYTGTEYTRPVNVYSVRGISEDRIVAAELDSKYYIYKNNTYNPPENLGQLFDEANLWENLKLDYFYDTKDYIENGSYSLNGSGYILEVLSECKDAGYAGNDSQTFDYKNRIDFSITLDDLGVYMRGLQINSEGYLLTNIFDYGYIYNIGVEAAKKIIAYAEKNGTPAAPKPYCYYLSGIVTELTEDYLIIDDSIKCADASDGILFKIPLDDIHASRGVKYRDINIGDIAVVRFRGSIDTHADNTVTGIIEIDKGELYNGNILVDE